MAPILKKPRAAKDTKAGDLRQQTLENKGRTPRSARDVKAGDLRAKTLENRGVTPRNPKATPSTGTKTSVERMSGTKKSYESRFKPPATRRTTEPVKFEKPKTSVTKYKQPKTSVTKYEKPKTSVAKSSAGGAGGAAAESEGILGKASRLARGAAGLGAATGSFYFGDTFSSKTGNQANYGEKEALAKGLGPLMKGNAKYDKPIGPKRPDTFSSKTDREPGPKRGTAGTYTKSYDVKPKAPSASVSSVAAPKKAGDKSTQASKAKPSSVTGTPAKPMTNFERMKARQYEKEGYGGRSMTSAGAKAQVEKERGYKLPTGRLTFGSKAKSDSGASKAVKQGSTSTFASKMQGRNVPGSPTYSPTKAKSGFKFSDIFNRKK